MEGVGEEAHQLSCHLILTLDVWMENQKVIKVLQQREGGCRKNQHVHGSLKHEQKRFEKKKSLWKNISLYHSAHCIHKGLHDNNRDIL